MQINADIKSVTKGLAKSRTVNAARFHHVCRRKSRKGEAGNDKYFIAYSDLRIKRNYRLFKGHSRKGQGQCRKKRRKLRALA